MNVETLTFIPTLAALRDERRKLPFAYLQFFSSETGYNAKIVPLGSTVL
jgi:hypothetical protein